jgi:hypothetical protein
LLAAAVVLFSATPVCASGVFITEWMYSGLNGEFIEFTNLSGTAVDFTGWSFDDDTRTPGSTDLSTFGMVAPGQSVILTEVEAAAFRAAWELSASILVLGGNSNNLGRNDEINLFDDNGSLVDRLTFGDQNIPGTIRTKMSAAGSAATPPLAPTTCLYGCCRPLAMLKVPFNRPWAISGAPAQRRCLFPVPFSCWAPGWSAYLPLPVAARIEAKPVRFHSGSVRHYTTYTIENSIFCLLFTSALYSLRM